MSNYRTDLLPALPAGYTWRVADTLGGIAVQIRKPIIGPIYSTVAEDIIRPPFMVSNEKVLNVATQLLAGADL